MRERAPTSSQSAMNRPGSGRPCRCHRSSWPAQKSFDWRPAGCRTAAGTPPRFAGPAPPVPVPGAQPVPGIAPVTAALHIRIRAQRRHLAQLRHQQWWQVDTAISDATHAIHRALCAGAWAPRQRQRLRQLDPTTLRQAAPGADPGWRDDGPSHPVIEIAIYPDVVRLAAHSLRTQTPATVPRRDAPAGLTPRSDSVKFF